MPKLVRLYIVSCAIGFGIAAVFVAGLLVLDVAHLQHLVFSSPMGWLAAGMMVMFNGLVFAGVQFGIAVMGMADPEDSPPRSRKPRVQPRLVLATVPAWRRQGGGNRSSRGDVNFPRA